MSDMVLAICPTWDSSPAVKSPYWTIELRSVYQGRLSERVQLPFKSLDLLKALRFARKVSRTLGRNIEISIWDSAEAP